MTAHASDRPARSRKRWRAALGPAGTLLLFAVALWVIERVLGQYHYADIRRAVASTPPLALALCVAATALGYLALVGYDYVAFRVAGKPLPLREVLAPSFVTFAVSNSAPASVVTAGGVRHRLYTERGVTTLEAAAVAGINVVTYALGLCALSGLVLLVHPVAPTGVSRALDISGRTLGLVLVAFVIAYFGAALAGRDSVTVFGHTLRLPSARLATAQLGVSTADWLLSSGALYVLLAGAGRLGYLDFLVRFLVAQVVALVVPIPGGIGVFEASVLYLTSAGAPAPRVLAALLVYRVVYYLLPLLSAGVVVLSRSVRHVAREGGSPADWLLKAVVRATPHLLAFVTFAAGVMLLLTGTVPANAERMAWLGRILPLPLIEASHFLGSVLGAAMLIVAWGLEGRVRSAYRMARVLFGAGILLTLLRAFDLRLAAGLTLALVILIAADRRFPSSDGSLLGGRLSARWLVAIGAALALTLSIGLFTYHGMAYTNELWWRFTLENGDAPRALRAAVGTSVTLLLFALARFLAKKAPPPLGDASGRDGGRRSRQAERG